MDGAEIDGDGPDGRPALIEALKARAFDAARWLVQAGASVNCVSAGGYSALAFAVEAGDPAEVEYLLQAGAHPDLAGRDGLTPLAVAARDNRPDLMRQLLAAGAHPNLTTSIRGRRENALSMALWQGSVELVDLLLANGANPRGQTYEFIGDSSRGGVIVRWTDPSLLMFAAAGGNVELIRKLIALGQDPKLKTGLGYDALTWAAETGHLEAVKCLLPLSELRGHALESARRNRRPEIVRWLEAAGYQEGGG
jgi:hypothetical protein